MSAEDLKLIPEAYEDLVTTVYEEFLVMLARSGFVANRLATFVQQDYILLIRNKINFTEYQQELFIATGMQAIDRMIQNYGGNPANVQTDLNMALTINKGNLEALEALLKDNVVANIARLKLAAEGVRPTNFNVVADSFKRAGQDYVIDSVQRNRFWEFPLTPMHILFQNMPSFMWNWFEHSDRYPLSSSGNGLAVPQSEFGDKTGVYSQLCVQALAFIDQSPLLGLCKDAKLKSPLTDLQDYSVSYQDKLNSHLAETNTRADMKAAMNHSTRICAFRDFNRKNMVLFMTLGRR